jgi:hypothetical protein
MGLPRADARHPAVPESHPYTQDSMNKKFATLALLAASTLATSAAGAADLTGWFVNGGAGRANYNATVDGYGAGSDHGSAEIVNAGYRTQFIGFEAGYTNLGSVSAHDATDSAKLSGDGWTVGLNGHFNPTEQWYISARGGAFVWKMHATANIGGQAYTGSERSLDWYAGVGTGYDINRHWSIGANFDYYKMAKHELDIGTRVFTVSAEYRF